MEEEIKAFLARIQDANPDVRLAVVKEAGSVGAPAIMPLGGLMASVDKGVAKSAGEALQVIVYHADRPGAEPEKRAVSQALAQLLTADLPRKVRAEAAHLLGFVGGDEAVPPLARLLGDPETREEARLALERIPGSASTHALQNALRSAPADFKANLEQSLRHKQVSMKTVGTEK
jgi:hypothetical protein